MRIVNMDHAVHNDENDLKNDRYGFIHAENVPTRLGAEPMGVEHGAKFVTLAKLPEF